MSIVVWDGRTLAGDRRGVNSGMQRTTRKIFEVNGALVGMCGDQTQGYDMIEWIRRGRIVDEFPPSQRDKDTWASVILIDHEGIWVFERCPTPMPILDRFFAIGSGRDYAMAAMHLGCNAREAVEVACIFDVGCGNGIDELRLG